MTHHFASARRRRAARVIAIAPAMLALIWASPALAVPPEQWVESDSVSPLSFLLLLVLIPAALFVVIALLAWLPSAAKGGEGYQPGLSWRHEPEWFGGTHDSSETVAKADEGTPAGGEDKGGASARW